MNFLLRMFRQLSIRGLLLLSVSVTLLPILAGLFATFANIAELTDTSEQTTQIFEADAGQNRDLLLRIDAFESTGRTYAMLQDGNSLREFQAAHERLHGQLRIAANAGLADAPVLSALSRDAENVFDALTTPPLPVMLAHERGGKLKAQAEPPRANPAATDYFRSLSARREALLTEHDHRIRQQMRNLSLLSQAIKHEFSVTFALMLPVSLVLVFVQLLHNPIQQIDHVIRAIGSGNFYQPIRVVGTSDVEFLGERLEWLRTRLSDLEMAKQRFVRNVSHEIKTPLATIHEGSELLLDEVVGELNMEQREIAQILANSADRLDRLIAELITYSQVSARREQQKSTLVDMRELVLKVLDDCQLQLRSKAVAINDVMESVTLMGNEEQLRTVVDNLLSNAIKYSPVEGEIRISLLKQGGHMELEVEDDGPGIDPDERERVFEPFFQGRAAHELGVKGTGFGLAIVAECVANHHGKIEVLESREGDAGARFRVQIPIQAFV